MKALPKDLRYLLFDLDGTLTDSAEGILRCVQYALEQCGTPEPDAEKLRPFIGPPLLDSFQEFCGMPPARAAFAVEQYRKRFSTVGLLENAVYDGIPELLEKLREHGYVLAVATSKPEVYTLRILEHFDLFKYFTAVAGCDIHRAGETKADMIRLALRRLGLPEQEPPLCLGFFLAFIRQKLFRHCRIAACVFQIAQEQDGFSVRFSHPVHLLWLVWVSVNQYNVKDNYSKYFLSMGVDA